MGTLFQEMTLEIFNNSYSTDTDQSEWMPAISIHWIPTRWVSSLESGWSITQLLYLWDPWAPRLSTLNNQLDFYFLQSQSWQKVHPTFTPFSLGSFFCNPLQLQFLYLPTYIVTKTGSVQWNRWDGHCLYVREPRLLKRRGSKETQAAWLSGSHTG